MKSVKTSIKTASKFQKPVTFKMRPSAQPFLLKMSFICMRMKNHFHIKG